MADQKNTQQRLADITGLSQPRISQLLKAGVINRADHAVIANRKIIAHLGEQAAGRRSPEANSFDLVAERARLAARQSEKAEIDNAKSRGELVPIVVVVDIQSFQNSTIRSRTLGIPSALKAKHPELPTPIFLSLKDICYDVLKQLSHVRFPADLDERIKQIFRDIHTAAKPGYKK